MALNTDGVTGSFELCAKTDMKVSMDCVNNMDLSEFTKYFGNVVYPNPICASVAWLSKPFSSVYHLHQVICRVLDTLQTAGKDCLLGHYPDLAFQGTLSRESHFEQNSAGLLETNTDEIPMIRHLNAEYKAKFGFPFIICARNNKNKSAMLKLFKKRLLHSKETERKLAIDEVKKICLLRLLDIVGHNSKL